MANIRPNKPASDDITKKVESAVEGMELGIFGHAVTPSPIDITALSHMYGLATQKNTGDTTYTLTDGKPAPGSTPTGAMGPSASARAA
jgi:hypothetical protein